MPNPLHKLVDKHMGPNFMLLLKQQVVGLAHDFWEDGEDNLLGLGPVPLPSFAAKLRKKTKKNDDLYHGQTTAHSSVASVQESKIPSGIWHAAPGEISEKMWGPGFVTPGDQTLNSLLITPLGLSKASSVLDLSAGLGGRMRKAAEETGAYITGLEPDAAIAERGMQMSVAAGQSKHALVTHYDPAKLSLGRTYDAFIARETFYRVPDRPTFFAAIAAHAKPKAQLAFTDYIVDSEHKEQAAVKAWQGHEKLANPTGLVEMAELWAKAGFSFRVHEDLSDFYKKEVKLGLNRLMIFLASGVQPDQETTVAVLRRIDIWKYRVAAMEAGMKFVRFYGLKH